MSALSSIAAVLRRVKDDAELDRAPDRHSRSHDHTAYEELPSGHLPGPSGYKGGILSDVLEQDKENEKGPSLRRSAIGSDVHGLRSFRGSRKFEDSPEMRAIMYGSTAHPNHGR